MTQDSARAGWRAKLLEIEPYVPGEQIRAPGLIKLNTNENPFPPPPSIAEALRGMCEKELSRYPDPDGRELLSTLAQAAELPEESVFIGHGSDEVLAFAFRAFFNDAGHPALPVLFPDITYSFYPVWCSLFGIDYRQVPLDGQFCIRAEDYRQPNGGIVLANPNAPTGIGVGTDFLEEILKRNQDSIVVIDEAYTAFGGQSAIPLIRRYDNLFVAQTLSKACSLAGLRLGMGYGSPDLIRALNAVKNAFNSYTVDSIAQRLGLVAAKEGAYFRARAAEVVRIRDRSVEAFRALGFTVPDSSANFFFASHPGIDAGALYRYLKGRDILIRHFDRPRIRDWVRISVGTQEQMQRLYEAVVDFGQQTGKE
ncbi:MAG: aminotransferase class I/II-fold pyridoxal phosphate-dependent enzyme [Clostridiales Family XIII bacterium]|jgi:histidinol-phosphate aminotransferase|nr:aminotransferase class I/II-fold pyridoxal phosphate-dependent enzyme [Clostridiales Family XIII bacterium]